MKLEKWAPVSEIVGGLAIAVTLVLLLLEVRENTNITLATAYERSTDSLNDWRLSLLQDADSMRVASGHYYPGLAAEEAEDRLRLGLITSAQWAIYEKTYFSRQYGVLGSQEWDRFVARICGYFALHPEYWRAEIQTLLTEEFARFTLESCAE